MTPDRWTKRQHKSRLERYAGTSTKLPLDAKDSGFAYRIECVDPKTLNDWLQGNCANSFSLSDRQVAVTTKVSEAFLWGIHLVIVSTWNITFASEDDATLFAIRFPEAKAL